MLNQHFVKQGIKEVSIENYIRDSFPAGDYSQILLQRTPLGLKIVIFTNKPGRIIGRGGRNIDKIHESLKNRFKLENPQIDIKAIAHPDLDAKIVSKQIASALERGYNYKKLGNIFLKRIMDAGAIGTQIVVSGKLGGSKSRTGKFIKGYIKHCGDPAKRLVDFGFYEAQTRPGKIGVTVKIMKEFQDITGEMKDVEYFKSLSGRKEIEEPEEASETEESGTIKNIKNIKKAGGGATSDKKKAKTAKEKPKTKKGAKPKKK